MSQPNLSSHQQNGAPTNSALKAPYANTLESPSAKLTFVDAETNLFQEGGKRKVKKGRKSTTTKQATKTTTKKSSTGSKGKKRGGALMDDVKNLAVPFAILLAKQGLQTMFDKKKKSTDTDVEFKAKTASQTSTARRRTTLTGGSCGSACAQSLHGGTTRTQVQSNSSERVSKTKNSNTRQGGSKTNEVKSRFEKLSKEIDAFLQKY